MPETFLNQVKKVLLLNLTIFGLYSKCKNAQNLSKKLSKIHSFQKTLNF